MSNIKEVFHLDLLALSRKENHYFSFRLVYNLYSHANMIFYVCSYRLRAHESGSILDLFSFRSDPYRSRVDATDMNPI